MANDIMTKTVTCYVDGIGHGAWKARIPMDPGLRASLPFLPVYSVRAIGEKYLCRYDMRKDGWYLGETKQVSQSQDGRRRTFEIMFVQEVRHG